MFYKESYNRDSVSASEERSLLQRVISLGVGYPYGRQGISRAAISDTNTIYKHILRTPNSQKYSDTGSLIREAQGHIRNRDDGYYLLDLHKGRILAKELSPIEDIIIDFTPLGTDDRILLRRRKGTCLHETRFLIVPDAVYLLGINRVCIPLNEFHMLSFITVDDSRAGLVVDYDATQNDRPMILFPFEENDDIIQAQLDHDDRCWTAECEPFIGNISFGRKNV